MSLQSENIPNLIVPEFAKDKILQTEQLIVSEWNEAMKRVDSSDRFEKIVLTDEQTELFNNWRNVAIIVADDFGCSDLVNFPEINDVPFYRVAAGVEDVPGDIIEAGVGSVGGGIFIAMGKDVEMSDERMRILFQHELGHMLMQNVALVDDNNKVAVINKGFEKVSRVEENKMELGTEIITYTKAAFCEPLAELFSYCCSNKMEKEDHVFSGLYIREICFVSGMLGNMCDTNNSKFIDEFKLLFNSFNHRDYSWYKHLIDSIEKNVTSKYGLDADEARNQAAGFVRDFNNTEMEQGVDVVRNEDNEIIHGRKLSNLAGKGGFFEDYEYFCNKLVRHEGTLRFNGTTTYFA